MAISYIPLGECSPSCWHITDWLFCGKITSLKASVPMDSSPPPPLQCDIQIIGGLWASEFSSDYRAHKLYLPAEWMILEQVCLASVTWWGSSFHLGLPTSGTLLPKFDSASGFEWGCNSLFPPVWGQVLAWMMSGSQRWLSCAPTVGGSLMGHRSHCRLPGTPSCHPAGPWPLVLSPQEAASNNLVMCLGGLGVRCF